MGLTRNELQEVSSNILMVKTKEQANAMLKAMGLKKEYKPRVEIDGPHTVGITLDTRRPVKIVDGIMSGVEIDVYDSTRIRVWTSQKTKAMRIARENKFYIRELDGEAELLIPATAADNFLHNLGAKVKSNRKPSPKALEALRQYRTNNTKNNNKP